MKNIYNHKEFKIVSGYLRYIFTNHCELCRRKTEYIEIHHNDKDKKNNDISNLFHLCYYCHKIVNNSHLDIKSHLNRIVSYGNLKSAIIRNSNTELGNDTEEYNTFGHP